MQVFVKTVSSISLAQCDESCTVCVFSACIAGVSDGIFQSVPPGQDLTSNTKSTCLESCLLARWNRSGETSSVTARDEHRFKQVDRIVDEATLGECINSSRIIVASDTGKSPTRSKDDRRPGPSLWFLESERLGGDPASPVGVIGHLGDRADGTLSHLEL